MTVPTHWVHYKIGGVALVSGPYTEEVAEAHRKDVAGYNVGVTDVFVRQHADSLSAWREAGAQQALVQAQREAGAATHPWTIPADSGDDTDDVGDPRDMTAPVRRRGGMTVRDEAAWAREVNTTGDHGSSRIHGDRKRQSKVRRARALGAADLAGLRVEQAVAGGRDFGDALYVYARHLDDESAMRLRQHWIYGERFWAWWQAREVARARSSSAAVASSLNAHGVDVSKIRPGDYVRQAHDGWWLVRESVRPEPIFVWCRESGRTAFVAKEDVVEHRSCPRIMLPNGEVAVDALWEHRSIGGYFVAERTGGFWYTAGLFNDWQPIGRLAFQNSCWECVWPPAEATKP